MPILKGISVFLAKNYYFWWIEFKIAKIESCQNWNLPKLEITKIKSWQNWKLFQYFLLKVSIFDELNWKLPKLKVAKIESCQIWMLPSESDLCISCHKLTVLIN